jgi:hypothetical protein
MYLAIGERQAPDALRIARRENLRNATAAIVRHEVDLIEPQGGTKGFQHLRLCLARHVLLGRRARGAVRELIDGDATAYVSDTVDHVAPPVAA